MHLPQIGSPSSHFGERVNYTAGTSLTRETYLNPSPPAFGTPKTRLSVESARHLDLV